MIMEQSIQKKLEILSDAAKYDVACTSSGVDRKGTASGLGNAVGSGICHTFSADGRCVSLLKILFTNECIFDCKYCLNRASNDIVRASFTPEEVCLLTMEFYRRNYIEGLFLSSGVIQSPNYTMELLCKTLIMLREVHHFNGYIHCKAVPGASSDLIEMTGWYADRMSVNLELPTAEGLRTLAPHKTRKNILNPMKKIQLGINESKNNPMISMANKSSNIILSDHMDLNNEPNILSLRESNHTQSIRDTILDIGPSTQMTDYTLGRVSQPRNNRKFVPAGQSTQMIIGATPENDYQILTVTEALYKKFDLKRVFFSAFIRVNDDSALPELPGGPPLLREHRLYQADWLLRFYGFQAAELLSEERPHFNVLLDPKCNWALGHLEAFPVEVNKADYYTLLRVPGIGIKSAGRIVKARKTAKLRFEDLKKMGIVLKRALYFITCNGKMMYPTKLEENYLTNQLVGMKERLPFGLNGELNYQQLSLFDNPGFANQNIVSQESSSLLSSKRLSIVSEAVS